ncbi:MAG: ABC-F family ATP-binding cassette domain-containing protein, partial [Selenomonadales bacterium]|nr:ABC-F family ATP-binding cassette domain-containing protein [Selenomonadales bacterium]
MEVIRIQDLTKAFGINEIFHNVSFTIAHGDKIGLIGPNGTGKSTLLRCILGEEEATAGEVIIPQGVRISYVEQQTEMTDRTLWDELHSAYHEILSWRAELADLETIISEEQDEEKLANAMRR